MKSSYLLSAALLVMFSVGTTAEPKSAVDLIAGEALAMRGAPGITPCVACHGESGAGVPENDYPRLAGLSQYYLRKQLSDFQSGLRIQETMLPIAEALSEKQINDVAAFFASLPVPEYPEVGQLGADAMMAGAQLAEQGDVGRQIVACANCHGPRGKGLPPAVPALIGQPHGYITGQLKAWRRGERKNDDGGLMAAVAKQLTAADIEAVAWYFSQVRPQ